MMHFDWSQRVGTFSGMFLILLMQIESQEVLKTIILAGIGGTSSYLFTIGIKFLINYIRKRF